MRSFLLVVAVMDMFIIFGTVVSFLISVDYAIEGHRNFKEEDRLLRKVLLAEITVALVAIVALALI